jgi:hypothetical protein
MSRKSLNKIRGQEVKEDYSDLPLNNEKLNNLVSDLSRLLLNPLIERGE